jgi:hypothetical protein
MHFRKWEEKMIDEVRRTGMTVADVGSAGLVVLVVANPDLAVGAIS